MAIWSDEAFDAEQQSDFAVPSVDLTGKVVIVTGANQGIGFEAAKHFALLGASKVIIACRDLDSGKAAAKAIIDALPSEKTPADVEAWYLDLASLTTVKAFVEKAETELKKLDILVSNAGVAAATKTISVDGLDTCVQINNIANSYLCSSLLPLLRRSASDGKPSRLVIVTSSLHWRMPGLPKLGGQSALWTLNELGSEKDGRDYAPYVPTKVVNVLDCGTLSDLAGPDVLVTCVNPGLCISKLSRDTQGEMKAQIESMWAKFGWTSEKGSRNLVWAATADVPAGSYVTACHVEEKSDFALSEEGKEVAKTIWADYEQIWKERGLL